MAITYPNPVVNRNNPACSAECNYNGHNSEMRCIIPSHSTALYFNSDDDFNSIGVLGYGKLKYFLMYWFSPCIAVTS